MVEPRRNEESRHPDAAPAWPGSLASRQDWSSAWSELDKYHVRFDPNIPIYREMHRKLRRFLRSDRNARFLEIGAFPGQLLWYFSRYFGYQVSGLEYLHWCCEQMRVLLGREGVNAQVIEGDLFSYAPAERDKWDVVCSHGFIEHFTDATPAVRRHFELAREGGLVILIVPNHATLYGRIMKAIRPDKYAMHNLMTLQDTLDAVTAAGASEIVFAGHIGRLGFWSCCLYETVLQHGRLIYNLVRAPLWLIEHAAQWLVPNSRALSPTFLVIARKGSCSSPTGDIAARDS